MTEFMGCSSVKSIGIHYGTVREAIEVADGVIDTLEQWYRWVISLVIEAVYGLYEIRAGILYNM